MNRSIVRRLGGTATRANLFGGKKQMNNKQLFTPPTKGESSSNPADLFKKNDILMFSEKPINYIESVRPFGFHLANNILIKSPNKEGDVIGALFLMTETFEVNLKDGGYKIDGVVVEFDETSVLSVLEKIHPKPELIVVGVGAKSRMLSPANRRYLSSLGMQIEVADSSRAAALYDLLATERPNVVAALLLPPNV
ncbi:hypothetical protein DIURU_000463 [Diutina rugosa]|uniref:NADH dehydrogenase [ubiquinone] 1 alpha subcomplex assembly factor 3 n=1 Tax=Diutina rugosa TaxID=5481 RepID=A0A642V3D8_DIURU|nr:uncharacterized protein DIURU_000463 [Diutina rugosa]KAA8907776.1 hypothetical protein DIURU_000463 [Diutina rugosa]